MQTPIYPVNTPININFDKECILSTKDQGLLYHWDTTQIDNVQFDNLSFDWASFSQFLFNKVDNVKVPNGYYWKDANGTVYYADIDLTNNAANTETQYQQRIGYNEHNTQFFKFTGTELGNALLDLDKFFPNLVKNKMIRVLIQMPGQIIPTHIDTFVTYQTKLGVADSEMHKVKRYCAFVTDWSFGHLFHYGTNVFAPWQAGDVFEIKQGVPHGSANAGFVPKITIQWDGMED